MLWRKHLSIYVFFIIFLMKCVSVQCCVSSHVETCYYKLTYSQDLPKSYISFRQENGLAVVGRLKGRKLENTFVQMEPTTAASLTPLLFHSRVIWKGYVARFTIIVIIMVPLFNRPSSSLLVRLIRSLIHSSSYHKIIL